MFDVKKTTEDCIAWIKDWFNKNGPESPAVIGISGGKDSSIVAALCVRALGKDRVIGVLIPDGEQSDIDDSWQLVKFLDIRYTCVNIGETMKAFYNALGNSEIPSQIKTNAPARMRMNVLYAVAANNGGRVANTSNKSEKFIGYSTKWGDSTGDFSSIGGILSTEVVEMGRYLGLPDNLVYKAPSDGMCGKTDEDNFGFTYADLDNYINGIPPFDYEIAFKIEKMHRNPNTAKKEYGIDTFNPDN